MEADVRPGQAPRSGGVQGRRLFRSVDDPAQVFIQVEFASVEDAKEGREKLLASGVLDRFSDKYGPTIVEEAETVSR